MNVEVAGCRFDPCILVHRAQTACYLTLLRMMYIVRLKIAVLHLKKCTLVTYTAATVIGETVGIITD